MHIYVQAHSKEDRDTGLKIRTVRILEKIAGSTDTRDLVVSVYFLPPARFNRGTAYVQRWLAPPQYHAVRGHWKFTRIWPAPSDLPLRYKLIRMRIDGRSSQYPRTEKDIYGWTFYYKSLEDHLALLFAHELHHYRRYHLGLHEREGEQAANRWALERAKDLGFIVSGRRLPIRSSRRPRRKRKNTRDPFSLFRSLKPGDQVEILQDPRRRYQGETAVVMRPIRSNSKRLVIRTGDGKEWRWPMIWLRIDKKA